MIMPYKMPNKRVFVCIQKTNSPVPVIASSSSIVTTCSCKWSSLRDEKNPAIETPGIRLNFHETFRGHKYIYQRINWIPQEFWSIKQHFNM